MRPLGSWLDRFRRVAAVPAAVADDLAAELLSVFAALDLIEAEAAEVRAGAAREAERRRAGADAEAERILERGRKRAEAERARAEAQRRAEADAAVREIEIAALAEAERIRRRGAARLPALVEEVAAVVVRGPR